MAKMAGTLLHNIDRAAFAAQARQTSLNPQRLDRVTAQPAPDVPRSGTVERFLVSSPAVNRRHAG
jgi:hypothetical protein